MPSSQNDPLLHQTMEVQLDQMASLTSGKRIFSELDAMISKNQAINSVILGPETTTAFFAQVFPNIVESNDVGKITPADWSLWNPGNNEVTLEKDPRDPNHMMDKQQGKDLYVGGPAALFSAALQSRSGQDPHRVLYCHDGARGTSNWKGSASYNQPRLPVPPDHREIEGPTSCHNEV